MTEMMEFFREAGRRGRGRSAARRVVRHGARKLSAAKRTAIAKKAAAASAKMRSAKAKKAK